MIGRTKGKTRSHRPRKQMSRGGASSFARDVRHEWHLLEGIDGVLLLGLGGDVKSSSAVDVSLVLAGASLEQELADSSVTVLGGKVERGGTGGEGLGGWHGAVVQQELADLVVTVSASVVEGGSSDVIDLVDVTAGRRKRDGSARAGLCFSNRREDEGRRGTEKVGDRASDSLRPLLHPRTLSFPSEEKATSRARLTACVRVGPSWI